MTLTVADLLSIELMRKHLRVDHQEDDDLIELYAESALGWALWYCDNPAFVQASDIPASFKSAILLLLGSSYSTREAVVMGVTVDKLPLGVESLLWSSRNFSGPAKTEPER